MIYADNAATTKLDIDAFEAMKPYLIEEYGNASQPYSFSRSPKKAIKEARQIIASCINAEPNEIYFTSGGTESDNWAIKGTAFHAKDRKAIITSSFEHHAVLRTCEYVETMGYPAVYIEPNTRGCITVDALESVITPQTLLVSIMMSNNEIGTVQPIKSLAEVAHKNGALFHTDAVQCVGHLPIDVKSLGVDMLSASAHKFNGPKGIGFLYVKKGTQIAPLLNGGSQESGYRAGTENVADGQHRVEGIKKALQNDQSLSTERVPVIFIGHSKDELGMQRTRRMFSTLNRYAKPVSLRDIIALDEDDIVAIASRNIIDNSHLFTKGRIFDSKNKSVPENNDMALTTIITYYEVNKELLWLHIKDKTVKGLDNKIIKGRAKVGEYIRHRPLDEEIVLFTDECKEFWSTIIDECSEIKNPDLKVGKYRDNNGGHIFFRPITLICYAKVVVRIKSLTQASYKKILKSFPKELLWIQNRLWKKVVWDDVLKKMVMGHAKLVELLMLYIYDRNILTEKEMHKMLHDLQSIWEQPDLEHVKERLDGIINGDVYI